MSSRLAFDIPIKSSDQSFDRVLAAGVPVAAVFHSRQVDSALEAELSSAARAEAGKLLVVKINATDSPRLVQQYGIHSTPTLVTFSGGEVKNRVENVTPAEFREHMAFLLGHGPEPRVAPPPTSPPRAETRPSADGSPVVVSDATFQRDVMQSSIPVVVDFWAPWCGPCRTVSPILEKLAAEYAGRIRVVKMNVDENPRVPNMHQVQGIPTLLFVKNGRVVNRVVGAYPERQIRSAFEALIAA